MSKSVIFGGLGIYPDQDTAKVHAEAEATARIRELNDAFRRDFPANGRRYITDGIFALDGDCHFAPKWDPQFEARNSLIKRHKVIVGGGRCAPKWDPSLLAK